MITNNEEWMLTKAITVGKPRIVNSNTNNKPIRISFNLFVVNTKNAKLPYHCLNTTTSLTHCYYYKHFIDCIQTLAASNRQPSCFPLTLSRHPLLPSYFPGSAFSGNVGMRHLVVRRILPFRKHKLWFTCGYFVRRTASSSLKKTTRLHYFHINKSIQELSLFKLT